MSAAPPTLHNVANGPLPIPAGGTPTPVEYFRSLPPEAKEAILFEALHELIAMYGGRGLIPFQAPGGDFVGYYVPPAAAKTLSDKVWAEIPAEVRERLGRPIDDLSNSIPAENLLDRLIPADGSPGR